VDFPSRFKYVLLMVKVQALTFIVFLQVISRIEGTLKGYIYSLLVALFFHIMVYLLLKYILIHY